MAVDSEMFEYSLGQKLGFRHDHECKLSGICWHFRDVIRFQVKHEIEDLGI